MTEETEYGQKVLEFQQHQLRQQKKPMSIYEAIALWLTETAREDKSLIKDRDDNSFNNFSC